MAVDVDVEQNLAPQKPRRLFEAPFATGDRDYDVLPNDEGFVMVQRETTEQRGELQVVLNWFQELKRLTPAND